MEMVPYHFDVLPIHPQPEPFESLTGYLIRLAEVNMIRSLSQMSQLCFPNSTLSNMRHLKDHPFSSLDTLSVAAMCSKSKLQATTFYHLSAKFDRHHSPQAVGRFLSSVIAPWLRYCPQCLAKYQYYKLFWRFQILEGCVEHCCLLLDRCGHCGQRMPLIATPLKTGFCPGCEKDLRACRAETLQDEVLETTKVRLQDLKYLLSPQPWEGVPEAGKTLGRRLAYWRWRRQLSQRNLANSIGMPLYKVQAIERENDRDRTGLELYFPVKF